MEQRDINPPTNTLPKELGADDVFRAIAESGYPLQIKVAASLAAHFDLTEEWSYFDRNTNQIRAIDLAAYRQLSRRSRARNAVPAAVQLLIECKASRLPYVFFRSIVAPPFVDFPQIQGVAAKQVNLFVERLARAYPLTHILGFQEQPFVANGPVVCATFSKIVRKGGGLELSGSDPFHSIVLPLIGALDHSQKERRPGVDRECHPTVVVAVCVLDAPMVVFDAESGTSLLEPWVRVIRQEVTAAPPDLLRRGTYAVDVVHAAFLESYIAGWLLPFAQFFRERVEDKPDLFRKLGASVRNLDSWTWDDLSV